MALASHVRARHAVALHVSDGSSDAAWLTPAERAQWRALTSRGARADYAAARIAGRCALAALRDDAAALSILRRAERVPAVLARHEGRWRAARVALALSHRDGRAAAIAAPRAWRVGIDVERRRAIAPAHACLFATADERARGPRDAAALWALKEAAWKALRLGASDPMCTLELEFDETRRVCAVRVRGVRLAARARLARPWPRHVVAVMRVRGAS